MKPEHSSTAGIHLLKWPEYNIQVRVDRLRTERDNLTGEITVKSTLVGVPSHLHQARFNLTSTTSRKTLANNLKDRLELPWDDIIEQTAVMVLTKHREGEPIVRVGNLPPRESLKYRVEPLLVNSQPTLIYGPGGTGKTNLALYLAVLLDGTPDHNGLLAEPGKVLYLDYETDQWEIDDRIKAIQKGLQVSNAPDILYRSCALPLNHEVEDIQVIVIENNIDVVIVDPLGAALGDNMNEGEPIISYFRALRSLRNNGQPVTTLSIDHTNKEGRLYGSEYKFHRARSVFEAKKQQEAGEAALDFGLFHRKFNNGALLKPMGFHLTFQDGAMVFRKKNVKEMTELSKALPMHVQIQELLKRGKLKASEIAEALGKEDHYVTAVISQYKGLFQKQADGAWGLTDYLHGVESH